MAEQGNKGVSDVDEGGLAPRGTPWTPHCGETQSFHQNYLHNSMEKIGPWQLAFPFAPHSKDAVTIIVLLHEQRAFAVQRGKKRRRKVLIRESVGFHQYSPNKNIFTVEFCHFLGSGKYSSWQI